MTPIQAVRASLLLSALCILLALQAVAQEGGTTNFLRGAVQAGSVLETNDFLAGDNLSGEPIDSFRSLRAEFGWQTDGSKDWHHVFGFPTYGIGLYGADLDNEEELGTPSSLYGFFEWPLARSERLKFSFGLNFGLTNDWKPYDPVDNPKNIALGLARSVHIEGGPHLEYRLARRWSASAGLTFTHFSNGGTQRPNHGLNTVGPVIFAKYDLDPPRALPARRHGLPWDGAWRMVVCGSAGKRNLNLPLEDPDLLARYGNRDYFIGNLTLGALKRFSYKSSFALGLDLGYDESVGDLMEIDAYRQGRNSDHETIDNFELALYGGYEVHAHRTHLLVHLCYKILAKDVPDRLPNFYQRLGMRQFFYRHWFAGLNVRFHEHGSADNLEWNLGYAVRM